MAASDDVIFDVQLTARLAEQGERLTSRRMVCEAASAQEALWGLLGQRVERALTRALGGGSFSVADLTRILAEPSDLGATAALLEQAATEASVVAVDPLAAAKARWVRAEESLLEAAGGTLSAEDVATLLGGVKRQAIEKRRDRGTLLGLRRSGGTFVYPVCQFHNGEVLPGLDKFLAVFPAGTDPWQMLNVLLGPSDALDGESPLDALRTGDVSGAVGVAESAFDE